MHSSLELTEHDPTANAPEVEQPGLELDPDADAPQVDFDHAATAPEYAYGSDLEQAGDNSISATQDASGGKEVIPDEPSMRTIGSFQAIRYKYLKITKKKIMIFTILFIILAVPAITVPLYFTSKSKPSSSPSPSSSVPTSRPTSTTSTSTTSAPASQPTTDGVYLVNGANGNNKRSGLAYYNVIMPGKNDNHQPNDYTDLPTPNVYEYWEGTTSGKFNDTKVVFTAMLDPSAASKPVGTVVGGASNGYRNFTVHKDDDRELYNDGKGWSFHTAYYCD